MGSIFFQDIHSMNMAYKIAKLIDKGPENRLVYSMFGLRDNCKFRDSDAFQCRYETWKLLMKVMTQNQALLLHGIATPAELDLEINADIVYDYSYKVTTYLNSRMLYNCRVYDVESLMHKGLDEERAEIFLNYIVKRDSKALLISSDKPIDRTKVYILKAMYRKHTWSDRETPITVGDVALVSVTNAMLAKKCLMEPRWPKAIF